jgi:hypothetical protein
MAASVPSSQSSCGGIGVLVLLLGGTLLMSACCVGGTILSDLVAPPEDEPPKMPPLWKPVKVDRDPEPVASPKKEEPPPLPPGAPIQVKLDATGSFTLQTTLDLQAPPFQHCRRFLLNAAADTAYLVEIREQRAISLRVKPVGGGPAIEPKGPFGTRHHVVLLPQQAQPYVILALGGANEIDLPFTLHVRAWDESEPLPEKLKVPANRSLPKLEVAHEFKDKRFLSAAFAPDGKTYWIANHDLTLDRFKVAADRSGSYMLAKRLYALAVDRGARVYAQAGPADRNVLDLVPRPIGDLQIYDNLGPKGDADELPLPARTILLRGLVGRMLASANGRWVYFLDVLNRKVGRIDTEAGTVDRLVDAIAAGATHAFCLRPDGKKIYVSSDTGVIDVIDTASFKLERTVALRQGKPYEITATDRGLVFVLGEDLPGQATCAVADLSRADADKVYAMPVPYGQHGQFLQMAPQQDVVFIGGDRRIGVCSVPSRPALEQIACSDQAVPGLAAPGGIWLSPDGRILLHDAGAILAVRR